MPYVRGHARRLGWVVGHHRRPHRAAEEQLGLDDGAGGSDDGPVEWGAPGSAVDAGSAIDGTPAVPAPRISPEGRRAPGRRRQRATG